MELIHSNWIECLQFQTTNNRFQSIHVVSSFVSNVYSNLSDQSHSEATNDHLHVQTVYEFYKYAAAFEETSLLSNDMAQVYRIMVGFFMMVLITDYLFLGPTNSMFLSGNLNVWGLLMTFMTMIL